MRNLCSQLSSPAGRLAKAVAGFTLVEVLVAAALTTLLTVLALNLSSQFLNNWQQSDGRLAANQQARIAMDLLTKDLQTAMLQNKKGANDDSEWLLVQNGTLANNKIDTVSLRLFSPTLDRPEGVGDLCAVSYELKLVDPVSGTDVAVGTDYSQLVLFRQVTLPRETFENRIGRPINWGADVRAEDFLVGNIVEFRIRLFDADGEVIVQDPFRFDGASGTPVPVVAEIKLRVLTTQGANLLQGSGDSLDLEELFRRNAHTFIRRVNLLGRPL